MEAVVLISFNSIAGELDEFQLDLFEYDCKVDDPIWIVQNNVVSKKHFHESLESISFRLPSYLDEFEHHQNVE